jgi:uncharacterized protein (UPF0261 family)
VQGIEEWDKPGEPAHDPEGLAAFVETSLAEAEGRVPVTALDCHINDPAFCDAVLAQLDAWVADGTVPAGKS